MCIIFFPTLRNICWELARDNGLILLRCACKPVGGETAKLLLNWAEEAFFLKFAYALSRIDH